jgi:glutathione S-transferase
MDEHLQQRDWFVGDDPSLADICLFAYTDLAEDAHFDLGRYPAVKEWLERVKKQPGFVPMDA